MRTFKQLRALLSRREQRQALLLLFLMFVVGIMEMVGVGSIFPLIAVLSDPSMIETNTYMHLVYTTLGFADQTGFFIFLSVLVLAIIVLRTGFTIFANYGTLRYAQMRAHVISAKLLGSYLRRPYSFFLNRHSADLGKSVLSEVEQVINGSLMPALKLVSQVIISICIIGLLFVVEPMVTLVAMGGLAVCYGIIYLSIRRYLSTKGKERVSTNRARFQIAQEVLAGVKEVKIGGHEAGYLRRFERASWRYARLNVQLNLLSGGTALASGTDRHRRHSRHRTGAFDPRRRTVERRSACPRPLRLCRPAPAAGAAGDLPFHRLHPLQ